MRLLRKLLLALPVLRLTAFALDQDGNQQSDVWEMLFQASGLAAADADGDGWTNQAESVAGTNPLDPSSFPGLHIAPNGAGSLLVAWTGLAGKRYSVPVREDLAQGTWEPATPDVIGSGGPAQMAFALNGASSGFYRLSIFDHDSDLDGVNDWEESALGFDPTRERTDRQSQTDAARVAAGLTAANTITVAATTRAWSAGLIPASSSCGAAAVCSR